MFPNLTRAGFARLRASRPAFIIACLLGIAGPLAGASAQVVEVPYHPQVGSANPASAAPPVSVPDTTPCDVVLFKDQEFADFNAKNFSYTPPAACPGPWAKVVLTARFTVTKGVQYDRTAQFFLGNVNIFYGTTAEPGSDLSPSWLVERDVTDLSALFKTSQSGAANIGNLVNSTYTGIIYATATLHFYPASAAFPAAEVPDKVFPMNTGNGAATLNTTSSALTATPDLPENIEQVYLDVIAQSQSQDEFWYLCVTNSEANNLFTCGNTAFREVEVTIDGTPAGVAPVYPWIYTGGLDPYLWLPIVGVQTLNFAPYRVDLTPFAGLLSDGAQHTVGVSVFNADSYFLVAADLLVYRDHGRAHVKGGIVKNTLTAAPVPVVKSDLLTDSSGTTTGTLAVSSSRAFKIHGYVNTSHGRVDTIVEQTVAFSNTQTEDVNPNTGPDDQYIVQSTTVDSVITKRTASATVVQHKELSYPLTLDYEFLYNADGTYTQYVSAQQGLTVDAKDVRNGVRIGGHHVDERVESQDILAFDANFNLTAPGMGTSNSYYDEHDSNGFCFDRTLDAVNHVLDSVTTNRSCN